MAHIKETLLTCVLFNFIELLSIFFLKTSLTCFRSTVYYLSLLQIYLDRFYITFRIFTSCVRGLLVFLGFFVSLFFAGSRIGGLMQQFQTKNVWREFRRIIFLKEEKKPFNLSQRMAIKLVHVSLYMNKITITMNSPLSW